MKTIAVVLASGSGTRFDKNIIKQYEIINGYSVIYHSALALKKNINIDKVVIVVNKEHKEIAKNTLKGLNITNFEMETSALYFLGRSLGHNTLTICAILGNRISKKYSNKPIETIDVLITEVLEKL